MTHASMLVVSLKEDIQQRSKNMQQMEHNRDVLEQLCPEQALETSASALGLLASSCV